MSILRRGVERRSLPPALDPYGFTARPAVPNYTGESVTEWTALSISTVLACVSFLADAIASMPLLTMERANGKMLEVDTPTFLLEPNLHQTSFQFVSETMYSLALHGNAFILVDRDRRGDPIQLTNLHPQAVTVTHGPDGSIVFRALNQDLDASNIVHIPWLTMPQRLLGVSPLEAQRTTLGLSLAVDRHLAQWYGNAGIPAAVLSTDASMSQDTVKALAEQWDSQHWRRRTTAVLTNGLKWTPITASASDMDTIASREQLTRDIARVYRIPPTFLLEKSDPALYANIESLGISLVRHTLLPWMTRIEQALNRLLPPSQHVKFDPTELMRGDMRTIAMANQIEIASGTMTPNEARAKLGREAYDGGDRFVMNLPGAAMFGAGELPELGNDDSADPVIEPGLGV